MTVLMADSTRPWLIPATIRYAAAYPFGRYEWTDDQIDRFAGHIMCAEAPQAVSAKDAAIEARELGIEDNSYLPSDAPVFVAARRALGHNDAQLYVNRGNMNEVADALAAATPNLSQIRWRVATLDGTKWVQVPFGILWAVQFTDRAGAYDLSVVYGPFDWTAG